MDAFGVLGDLLGDYENFVKGFLEFKDDQIRTKVEAEIADGLLWPATGAEISFHRHHADTFEIANRRESYVRPPGGETPDAAQR